MAKRNEIVPSSLPCVIEYRIKRAQALLLEAASQLAGIDLGAMSDPELVEWTTAQMHLTAAGVADLTRLAPSKKPARKEA